MLQRSTTRSTTRHPQAVSRKECTFLIATTKTPWLVTPSNRREDNFQTQIKRLIGITRIWMEQVGLLPALTTRTNQTRHSFNPELESNLALLAPARHPWSKSSTTATLVPHTTGNLVTFPSKIWLDTRALVKILDCKEIQNKEVMDLRVWH